MTSYAVPREVWLTVLERDNYQCQNCGTEGGEDELHPHHHPKRSQGGRDVPEDIVAVCFRCHDKIENHLVRVLKVGEIFYFSRRQG